MFVDLDFIKKNILQRIQNQSIYRTISPRAIFAYVPFVTSLSPDCSQNVIVMYLSSGTRYFSMHREYSFEARLIIILLSSTTSLYNLSSQKSYKFAEVPIAAFACISRRYGSTPSIGFHPRISSDFSKNTGLLHVPVLSVSTFIFLAGDNIIFISLIPAAYFPDRPLLLPCHLL